MTAERVTYLDSSAIIKLAVAEPESTALRHYLRRRRPLVTSALARTEVGRALAPLGTAAVHRGGRVLTRVELVRLSTAVLDAAAVLPPIGLRSLDAIHLATAQALGGALLRIVTYDDRMADAATAHGWDVVAPS